MLSDEIMHYIYTSFMAMKQSKPKQQHESSKEESKLDYLGIWFYNRRTQKENNTKCDTFQLPLFTPAHDSKGHNLIIEFYFSFWEVNNRKRWNWDCIVTVYSTLKMSFNSVTI